VILSEGFSRDSNLFGAATFVRRFGAERGAGQAADDCVVDEKRGARVFRPSPFGLPSGRLLWIQTRDRRKPSLRVRRWAADPNSSPDAEAEALPARKRMALRFEGKAWAWATAVKVPVGEPSWLVIRVAWPDPDDCAAGDDYIMSGVSFEAAPGPAN
jgi:hypothetical protein